MANRGMTSAFLTENAKQRRREFHLVQMQFSTTVYMTDSGFDVSHGGNNYSSIGNLLSIGDVIESINPRVQTLPIALNGVNTTNLSLALSENYNNKRVIVYKGLFDEDYNKVADPIVIFDGRIDNYDVLFDPTGESGESFVNWVVASHWADWNQIRGRKTNNDDQQSHFSGDLGLEFASEIIKDLKWGGA